MVFRSAVIVLTVVMALFGAGCASQAERQQREYERYVQRSMKAKKQRQLEYLKSRQQAPAPGGSAPEAPQAAPTPQQPRWDVQMEAVPASGS